jgi:HAD superfamily hydrolase (TIGR01457 family)
MALHDRYGCFLFDLDGVLYRGDLAIEHAPETLSALRAAGKRISFVTNNSSRTPAEVAAKLTGLGIVASPEEVVTSARATADLLASRGGGTAFVVGEKGIREALEETGLRLLDGEGNADGGDDAQTADFVVVGWDRTTDYDKLKTACVHVQRGAELVATNADLSFPAGDGLFWPGAGALLSVIVLTTGATPEVVGKPHTPLFELARARAGGGRPLVVGDRLDTDIAGAAALGWDSMLVLSGISSERDVAASPARPTYLVDDVSAITSDPEPERFA